ncbi:hypothetical protein HK102_002351, partial [Quaeritorhiza haematococci]
MKTLHTLFVLPVLMGAAMSDPLVFSPSTQDPNLPTKGLILLHGANTTFAPYIPLGKLLAEKSPEFGVNLHVSLAKSIIPGWPDPIHVSTSIKTAVKALKEADVEGSESGVLKGLDVKKD